MAWKPRVNPFRVGGPIQDPADFAGRKEVLQTLSNAMLSLQNISLRGERRTGKTSLLLYLAHPSSSSVTGLPETHIPVYFNFQDYTKANAVVVWQELANAIATQIEQRHPNGQTESKRFFETIAEFLTPSKGADLASTAFGRAFAYLDISGFKFTFLFDEFEQTKDNPHLGNSFYHTLRGLPTRAENISYVIATRTGLAALQSDYRQVSSPFFNIFTQIILEPFQEQEAQRLIFNYFDRSEVDISLAKKLCAESFLDNLTGYHPFFLQAYCYHFYENLTKFNWSFDQAQREALQAFEEDSKPHFKYYWSVSSKKEQELLKKLSTEQSVDWDQPENTTPIKTLQERCLVVPTNETKNKWRIFSSSFNKWVENIHFQSNPFITSGPVPPTHFIGREDIIRKCYNRLAGPVQGGIAFSGEHGLGKTSLLHYIRFAARQGQWGQANIFIYLYCPDLEQFTPNRFYRRILERIEQEEDDVILLKHVHDLLEKQEIDYREFRRFLHWLTRQRYSLVLLLDGFTWIIKTDTANQMVIGDFLSHLRSLTNDPGYSLILIIATREPLNILCQEIVKDRPESYFYNGFIFQPLTPFTSGEIDALLTQPLKEVEFEFDPNDRELLHHMAGAHPALLQLAAFLLFEERRDAPLSSQMYKKVTEAFEREARQHFDRFWLVSSPLEQSLIILLILAHMSEQTTVQIDLAPEEITGLLQKYERDLILLTERGLVQEIENTYQIFSVVFAWWLVREITAENRTSLMDHYKTIGDEVLQRLWQVFEKVAPRLTLDKLSQKLTTRDKQSTGSSGLPARYQILEELGRGASGIVSKALDTQLGRTVAIKLLHSHSVIPLDDGSNRLLREARAASKLQHPHIVTLYDIEEVDDQIFLVMEYLEGQTLADLLKERGKLSLKQVITWVEQVASALDYAHAQGVIHRDIKPTNLMITNEGALKLTDFGIAKVAGDPQTTHGTELKGTVLYMSPEQINQEPLDGRSDLFSLATVAYEMLSGDPPWPGTAYFDLMNQITTTLPRSLKDYDIPNAIILDLFFQKALAKKPDERYQRGEDFVQALKAITIQNIEQIVHALLTRDYTKEKLICFCYDEFKPVYEQLSQDADHAQVVNLLIEYARKHSHLSSLLDLARTYSAEASRKPDHL